MSDGRLELLLYLHLTFFSPQFKLMVLSEDTEQRLCILFLQQINKHISTSCLTNQLPCCGLCGFLNQIYQFKQ